MRRDWIACAELGGADTDWGCQRRSFPLAALGLFSWTREAGSAGATTCSRLSDRDGHVDPLSPLCNLGTSTNLRVNEILSQAGRRENSIFQLW
jgi:hypothetical protein